ncbi:MAG: DUF4296 domain-containing protein [Bacteroidia bacterium]|nr:DUF4296 domain-containing protein [Bacteroidia bacterium]
MLKPLFYILIFSTILLSCTPDKEEDIVIPSYLLSEEQLVSVLTDAYLSEGASGINVKNVIGEKYDSAYVFNPLQEHHISKSTFDSTMNFYTKHPQKLKLIYEKVLEKLSVIQANGKLE